MEELMEILKKLNLQRKTENSTIASETKSSKCDICGGIGWLYELNEFPRRCSCFNDYMAIKKNEKIKEVFCEAYSDYTFDNFKTDDDFQKRMKSRAMEFVKAKGINSILLLGQTGSGKTHLAVSIAKVFLDKGAWIEMMSYTEEMIYIKQNMIEKEEYQKKMQKYKNCNYLIIDDFLKNTIRGNTVNEKDFGIIHEIIDYRYKYKKSVIVTSEYFMDQMYKINESITGRLKEMATQNEYNFLIQISNKEGSNYRMRGMEKI